MRVVIACGGTGGHLFPGIALAEHLEAQGHRVTALISPKAIDSLAVERYGHLRFATMPSVALPPLFSPQIFSFGWRFLRSVWHSWRLLRRERAEVVVGMGGFTSFVPLLVGKLLGLRAFFHESNAIAGKANRWAQFFVDGALLGFEFCGRWIEHCPRFLVGTPIREGFGGGDIAAARAKLSLDPAKKTILLVGGSQGARHLNEAFVALLSNDLLNEWQVIHIAGPAHYEDVLRLYQSMSVSHRVLPFCHDMPAAFRAADFVVCRAGAATLSELAAAGRPAVLVPYPYAAENHQYYNALAWSRKGAALLVIENEEFESQLHCAIMELVESEARRRELAGHATSLCYPDTTHHIAEIILQKSS